MSRNQLFRIPPELSFVEGLLSLYGLNGLDDTSYFTKEYLKETNIIEKFNEITDELKRYYLPCKYKVYVNDITEQKCITILRQFLKLHNYTLISKEKYTKGKKIMIYRLIKADKKFLLHTSKKSSNIITSFE